jgi:5-methylcytosine-specific restriction endonuclease McrA
MFNHACSTANIFPSRLVWWRSPRCRATARRDGFMNTLTKERAAAMSLLSRKTQNRKLQINRNDLLNRRFGRWTVIEQPFLQKTARMICRCDCGKTANKFRWDLLRGYSKSCGCLRKEVLSLPPDQRAISRLIKRYRYNARNVGLEFNLTRDQVLKITSSNCAYCGSYPITHRNETGSYRWNGMDRIDRRKGYNADNVQPCCWPCNFAKGKSTQDEFLSLIKRIYEHRFLKT